MNTWKVILATLVIFGAGVVTGALVVKQSHRAPWRSAFLSGSQPKPQPSQPGEISPRGTNRMSNAPGPLMGLRRDLVKSLGGELELTDTQRENIDKILAEGQEQTRKIWEPVAPQMKQVWSRIKNDIRAQLTDEQKKHFDDYMKRPRKQEERRPQQSDNLPPKSSPQATPGETPTNP